MGKEFKRDTVAAPPLPQPSADYHPPIDVVTVITIVPLVELAYSGMLILSREFLVALVDDVILSQKIIRDLYTRSKGSINKPAKFIAPGHLVRARVYGSKTSRIDGSSNSHRSSSGTSLQIEDQECLCTNNHKVGFVSKVPEVRDVSVLGEYK
ncbi:hypothetical protein C2S52_006395 [Perilla frutescens var. hirtella]|nr:hypothetical protein C2S52_006395 [Perilla frutescens var. hirtella]